MKLISLATWGCRVTEPIFEYIKNNAESTDVFCFQEILKGGEGKIERGEVKSGYEDISGILKDYTGYFLEYQDCSYYGESSSNLDFKYGIACFVRKNLKQNFISGIGLYDQNKKWGDYSGRFAVGSALAVSVEDYVIINIHGLWQGSIKGDTEAKIEQSQKIIDLAESVGGKKIICGDFNLLPDTKAIQMLSSKYKNLIEEYKITETRSSLYTKELRYSDYAFVDKDIKINDFSVPKLNISDHLPLVLDFE